MAAYFWHGIDKYLASSFQDGWSYISYGQYLWEYSRGMEGGLAPFYQYSGAINSNRFMSSAFLALFSFFKRGDTQIVMGIFQAWTLFVFAASVTFFSIGAFHRKYMASIYTCALIFSGWVFNVLWLNNLDHLLSLGFLPVLVIIIQKMNPKKWSWAILIGLLAGSLLYIYPEMAVFILGSSILVFGFRLLKNRELFSTYSLFAIVATLSVFVLVLPYLKDLLFFMQIQINATKAAIRPGETLFVGLLSANSQPSAFLGFGSEWGINKFLIFQNIFGFLLGIFFLLGIIKQLKNKNILLIVWLISLGATLYMLIRQNYSYGAYKLILLNLWGVIFLIFAGFESMSVRLSKSLRQRLLVNIVGICILVVFGISTLAHIAASETLPLLHQGRLEHRNVEIFKSVKEVEGIIGRKSVIICVDDWLSNEWAVYFLRDLNVYLPTLRAYMNHPAVVGFMERSKKLEFDKVRFILTDKVLELANQNLSSQAEVVWSNGLYTLWRLRDSNWQILADARGPRSFEQQKNTVFVWLGKETIFRTLSGIDKKIVFTMNVGPGPGHDDKRRKISVSINGKVITNIEFDSHRRLQIPFTIKKGLTDITVQTLKPSEATVLSSNNDQRELLVGISDIIIK